MANSFQNATINRCNSNALLYLRGKKLKVRCKIYIQTYCIIRFLLPKITCGERGRKERNSEAAALQKNILIYLHNINGGRNGGKPLTKWVFAGFCKYGKVHH